MKLERVFASGLAHMLQPPPYSSLIASKDGPPAYSASSREPPPAFLAPSDAGRIDLLRRLQEEVRSDGGCSEGLGGNVQY